VSTKLRAAGGALDAGDHSEHRSESVVGAVDRVGDPTGASLVPALAREGSIKPRLRLGWARHVGFAGQFQQPLVPPTSVPSVTRRWRCESNSLSNVMATHALSPSTKETPIALQAPDPWTDIQRGGRSSSLITGD